MDHLGLVVELYTKAYEMFKSASTSTTVSTTTAIPDAGAAGVPADAGGAGGQGLQVSRQTLCIAYRIAETYREGGKYDLAVRWVLCLYFPCVHFI